MPVTTAAPSITTEQFDVIFGACDANRSGDLDLFELRYALQAFGHYPSDAYIQKEMKKLNLQLPLGKPSFRKLVGAVETNGCPRGLRAVPYSRRGLSLKQLKQVEAANGPIDGEGKEAVEVEVEVEVTRAEPRAGQEEAARRQELGPRQARQGPEQGPEQGPGQGPEQGQARRQGQAKVIVITD